jgi:hypothetical protein
VPTPFIGYSIGRRYMGHVDRGGERLADLFNGGGSVVIRDAFVENYDDDTVVHIGDVTLDRSILYAVELGGGGAGAGRTTSGRRRIHVRLGPYSALGLVPGSAEQTTLPMFDSNGPMVRLTQATIGYTCAGAPHLRDVAALLVNRDLMDWVRAGEEDAGAFEGVPFVADRT